jgi:hypothetical protein
VGVIDRWDGRPKQLELFPDLPRIYCITKENRYDAIEGTKTALRKLRADTELLTETIVTVAYLTSTDSTTIEVYANGSSPTIERTCWLLQKALAKML